MADWWEQYPVVGGDGVATATPESGSWWEQYKPANAPAIKAAPEVDPLADEYTAMYQEMGARIDPADYGPMKDVLDQDEFGNLQADPDAYAALDQPQREQANQAIAGFNSGIDQDQASYDRAFGDANPYERFATQTVAGLGSSLSNLWKRVTGDEEGVQENVRDMNRLRATFDKRGGVIEDAARGAAESLGGAAYMAPTGVAGIIGKAIFDSYNDSKTSAIDSGMSEEDAAKYARGIGAIEGTVSALFQRIGLGGTENIVGKAPAWKGFREFAKQIFGELSEEEIISHSQSALDKLADIDPNEWTLKEAAERSGKVALQSLMSVGAARGMTSAGDFASRQWPSRKQAKDLGISEAVPTAKARHDLAEGIRNQLTGQQFTEQLRTAATSPEEADALLEIYKARAASAGESFDDYVGKRIGGVEKTTRESVSQVRGQKVADGRRGEIEFLAEGPAIIRAFETQTVGTLAHETGHLFRRDLLGDDLKTTERWAGVRNGKWNRKSEEKFARGFERYLATGEAPTTKLANVFEKFKTWLAGVYGAIKGTAIDVNISPEMRGVFDRLLTPADGVTSRTLESAPASQETAVNTAPTADVDFSGRQPAAAAASPDILSQDLADRFRGLANQTAIPEAREANYEADVAMGFPERKSWAEAEQRAARRIQADPAGELARVVARIDQANEVGGVINLENQEETAMVNRLSDMLAMDLANPESRALHRKLRFAFRAARSDQARALGYRDPLAVMDPESRRRKNITDAIAEPTPKEAAERQAARTPEQHAEVDRKMEERYNAAKEALAKQGIDLDDIDSIIADPKKAMVVMDHLRAQGGLSDVLFEYWRNSILSGPTTHATNAIGNTAFGAWNLGPERLAEAAVNLFARNKKAASFGEFKYLLGGVLPGVMRGWRNARQSWSLETSALAEELGREGAFKVDGPRGAIKGKMGRLVRAFGYRPLLAADEFAKSLVVTMEVGAHAYRNGKAQGLEGEDLQNFIQQQTDDLGSVSWSQAFGKAEELTFQGQRGLIAQKIAGGGHKLRQFKGARWVLPFVETPAAIFEQGIKRTPILGAILDYAEARRSGMNIVDAGMTPTIARQLIAMGGLAMLWDAVGGDEPWLTGADPLSDAKNRDVSYRARPPMSIRIGDQWYSYARIEPFATAIASTADAVKGIQNGKYYKPLTGLVQQAKEKSYLDGLGDAIDAVQGAAEGDLSATEQWASKFAASWVPNLYRQTVRAREGEMHENRMWGKQGDRFTRFLNRTAQQAQLPFIASQPRFDVWGRPISYNDMGDHAATSFAYRLLSPVKSKDLSTVEQADLALIRWNEKHSDDQEVYSEPQKFVTVGGETKYLTDEQHAQYAELSGQLAQEAVSGLVFDPVDPSATDIRRIKKAITDARKMARENLVPTWELD